MNTVSDQVSLSVPPQARTEETEGAVAVKDEKGQVKAAPLDIPEAVLELLERRLADRVEQRVVGSVNKYLSAAAAVGAVVGSLLAFFGYQKLADFRLEALTSRETMASELKSLKDQAQLAKAEIRQFREGDLPLLRDEQLRYAERERQLRFTESCPSEPTVDQLQKWLHARDPALEIVKNERGLFTTLLRDYNVCRAMQVDSILSDSIQRDVDRMYRQCLGRAPDIYGRLQWGLRLLRGWTASEVREGICKDSTESERAWAGREAPAPTASPR